MGSIGITVGVIGYFLFFFIELLSDTKYRTVRSALVHLMHSCKFVPSPASY